jgi:heme A synthase
MYANNSDNHSLLNNRSRGLRYLVMTAAIATFLLMVMGNIVRVSGAAQACPDWPTCYGSLGLPFGDAARLQVVHRALAAVSGLLTLAAAVWAWLRFRGANWVSMPLMLASALVLVDAGVGGAAASLGKTMGFAYPPLHLALAMLALGLLTAACVATFW